MDAVGSGAGYKPLIATAATTSVSALAESDVYLPCKVKGHPAPTIAWTKVSTGKKGPVRDWEEGMLIVIDQNQNVLLSQVNTFMLDRDQVIKFKVQLKFEAKASQSSLSMKDTLRHIK